MDQNIRPSIVLAVAWYREDQWSRLRELASDADKLAETHADWLETAERRWRQLVGEGVRLRRAEVDIEFLWAWCCANGRSLDGSARAEYVAHLAQELTAKGELE